MAVGQAMCVNSPNCATATVACCCCCHNDPVPLVWRQTPQRNEEFQQVHLVLKHTCDVHVLIKMRNMQNVS